MTGELFLESQIPFFKKSLAQATLANPLLMLKDNSNVVELMQDDKHA